MRRSTSVASTASAEAALPVQPTDSPAPTSSLWHVQVVARHDQRYQMAVGQKRQPLFIQVRGHFVYLAFIWLAYGPRRPSTK
jgi:hypothetical protein